MLCGKNAIELITSPSHCPTVGVIASTTDVRNASGQLSDQSHIPMGLRKRVHGICSKTKFEKPVSLCGIGVPKPCFRSKTRLDVHIISGANILIIEEIQF